MSIDKCYLCEKAKNVNAYSLIRTHVQLCDECSYSTFIIHHQDSTFDLCDIPVKAETNVNREFNMNICFRCGANNVNLIVLTCHPPVYCCDKCLHLPSSHFGGNQTKFKINDFVWHQEYGLGLIIDIRPVQGYDYAYYELMMTTCEKRAALESEIKKLTFGFEE